jgi:CheY-like chemotaxis protein
VNTLVQAILLVEDNEDDVLLMRIALKRAHIVNPIYVVGDGQSAVEYLSGGRQYGDRDAYPIPAIAFLDVNLPYKAGHDVLTWIRHQKQLESLIVIMLTASNEPTDINRCYSLGANSYLLKPPTPEQLKAMAKAFQWYWVQYDQYLER